MGTRGNRPGYKVFSINTTLRNPKRNDDFLSAFQSYDGMVMDDDTALLFLRDCVQKGYYQFKRVAISIRQKWEKGIDLTTEEVARLIKDNPQKTGAKGRVLTQLRALKDVGFLSFEPAPRKNHLIRITQLGKELLEGRIPVNDVYTKAMIGLQAKSPVRDTMWNESRPFLNTLFVIDELQRLTAGSKSPSKGLHPHEFSVFVLSMTDCNYKQAAKDILDYRSKYRHEYDSKYCQKYLKQKGIIPINKASLIGAYPDDVFRKFEMTGLIVKRGAYKYIYYDFSAYNYGKIKSLLDIYKDYCWVNYSSATEYNNALAKITLPWEQDDSIKKHVVEMKAKVLNIAYDQDRSIEENEEILDRVFFTNALKRAVEKTELSTICKELHILSGVSKEDSAYDDIPEPLRLEYMLALMIGKKFGTDGLVSNILYNEEGRPLHCAAAGKFDILYYSKEGSYILEPTMQTSRNQQLNSETTNVDRHARETMQKLNTSCHVVMVAPRVHSDVVKFFKFLVMVDNSMMTTLSIEKSLGMFMESNTIPELNASFDGIIDEMKNLSLERFADKINAYVYAQ